MEHFRRKTWLRIAARYEAMPAAEQSRMRERMRDWARLAPEERRLARQRYKSLKRVDPQLREVLRQNWEDYAALPEAERKRLQDNAVRRPPVSNLPPPPKRSDKTVTLQPLSTRKAAPPVAPEPIFQPEQPSPPDHPSPPALPTQFDQPLLPPTPAPE